MSSSQTSSRGSAASPARTHPFFHHAHEYKPSREDLNATILEYLVAEGFPQTAQRFASETNLPAPQNVEAVEARVVVRDLIHAGHIKEAIHKINDIDARLLDMNPALHFALLRLQMIEMVRKGQELPKEDNVDAILFARAELAPRAERDRSFLHDLNMVMALVVYDPKKRPDKIEELLRPALRMKIAEDANRALRVSTGVAAEARLKGLFKLRAWAEMKAREAKVDIPARIPLGLELADDEGEEEDYQNGNGRGSMEGNGLMEDSLMG